MPACAWIGIAKIFSVAVRSHITRSRSRRNRKITCDAARSSPGSRSATSARDKRMSRYVRVGSPRQCAQIVAWNRRSLAGSGARFGQCLEQCSAKARAASRSMGSLLQVSRRAGRSSSNRLRCLLHKCRSSTSRSMSLFGSVSPRAMEPNRLRRVMPKPRSLGAWWRSAVTTRSRSAAPAAGIVFAWAAIDAHCAMTGQGASSGRHADDATEIEPWQRAARLIHFRRCDWSSVPGH